MIDQLHGAAPSNRPEANPVIGSLFVHGLVTRDELALGLNVTPDGRAVGGDGKVVPNLFVAGTLRKSQPWESTAVPELRMHAAEVAGHLIKQFPTEMGTDVGL